MNEQLQNALATILGKAIEGIDAGVEFMSAELPEVIEQLLMWYAVSNAIFFLLGFVWLYIAYRIVKFAKIKPGKGKSNMLWDYSSYNEEHTPEIGWAFVGATIVIFFVAAFDCFEEILTTLQIVIAPKIWLIEYAAQLTK